MFKLYFIHIWYHKNIIKEERIFFPPGFSFPPEIAKADLRTTLHPKLSGKQRDAVLQCNSKWKKKKCTRNTATLQYLLRRTAHLLFYYCSHSLSVCTPLSVFCEISSCLNEEAIREERWGLTNDQEVYCLRKLVLRVKNQGGREGVWVRNLFARRFLFLRGILTALRILT